MVSGVEYLSHEWYVREVERLGQQNLNLERYRMDIQRRNWMLVEYMAKQGVPLDEIGMREDYEFETAGQIRTEDDARRLEDFRKSIVMLTFDAEEARSKGGDAGKVLDVVLKAMHRNVESCNKKAMTMATAREKAKKSVASIPHPADIREIS